MLSNSQNDALFAGVIGQEYELLKLLSPLSAEPAPEQLQSAGFTGVKVQFRQLVKVSCKNKPPQIHRLNLFIICESVAIVTGGGYFLRVT